MIMPDEKAKSAIAFLKAAVAYYNSLGVTVAGVMTDNGSCYKAFAFGRACKRLKLKHIRTRPYTPKTNGKAENLRWLNARVRECGRWRRYQLRRRTPAWSRGHSPKLKSESFRARLQPLVITGEVYGGGALPLPLPTPAHAPTLMRATEARTTSAILFIVGNPREAVFGEAQLRP